MKTIKIVIATSLLLLLYFLLLKKKPATLVDDSDRTFTTLITPILIDTINKPVYIYCFGDTLVTISELGAVARVVTKSSKIEIVEKVANTHLYNCFKQNNLLYYFDYKRNKIFNTLGDTLFKNVSLKGSQDYITFDGVDLFDDVMSYKNDTARGTIISKTKNWEFDVAPCFKNQLDSVADMCKINLLEGSWYNYSDSELLFFPTRMAFILKVKKYTNQYVIYKTIDNRDVAKLVELTVNTPNDMKIVKCEASDGINYLQGQLALNKKYLFILTRFITKSEEGKFQTIIDIYDKYNFQYINSLKLSTSKNEEKGLMVFAVNEDKIFGLSYKGNIYEYKF